MLVLVVGLALGYYTVKHNPMGPFDALIPVGRDIIEVALGHGEGIRQ